MVLGGLGAADTFVADLLFYVDRPDTASYTTLWTVGGTKRTAASIQDRGRCPQNLVAISDQ